MVLDNDGQGDTSVSSACISNSCRHISCIAWHEQFLRITLFLWKQVAGKQGMLLKH